MSTLRVSARCRRSVEVSTFLYTSVALGHEYRHFGLNVDTLPTPCRHPRCRHLLPFFEHISATFMSILTRSFPDPVAVVRAPLVVVLVDESRANFVFHLTICSASTNTFPAILIRSSFEL